MEKVRQRVIQFVKARDWEQFHNPKDTAISLSLEAAEVLEHFQWKNPAEITKHLKEHKDDVTDELVDVLYWVILMGHYFDIDLEDAFERKMQQNERKYPVEQAKGRHAKYTTYQKQKNSGKAVLGQD